MSDTPEFDELVSRLRALLTAEYHRGQADERQRIRGMLGTEVTASTPIPISSSAAESATRVSFDFGTPPSSDGKLKRARAPIGAPEALIMRILTERGERGAAATDIVAAAESDAEKMVSVSGIRFVLDKGRAAGKYRNASGRWFLVREEEKN
jgi:hypothetical protein